MISIAYLSKLTPRQPHDNETILQATYVLTVENKQYIYELLLPETSPIRSVSGRPSSRKSTAKRSAAFEACLLLRQSGYLDERLLPTYHKQLPAMRNAQLALNMKKTNAYTMRVKPKLWEETRGSLPDVLYLTLLILASPQNLGRPYQPLALLTRTPLPEIPRFPLHLQPGKSSEVLCVSIARHLAVSTSTLDRLTSFTLRVYKDVFNKVYEVNQPQMSYWLAPVTKQRTQDLQNAMPTSLIDWSVVNLVHEKDEIPWTIDTPHEDLANRYLVDRWDGGRRFFSVGVTPELRPLNQVPKGCPAHKYMDNILDYTVSLFSKSRTRATWRPDQPVLLAHRVLHRRNLLDDFDKTETEVQTRSYVCPEPLKFSAV